MIIIDLFDIDFHIFTVIKFLFNLGVRIKYIYLIVRINYIYLSTPIDITDDTSSTLVCISDTELNDIDNSSETSESQSLT